MLRLAWFTDRIGDNRTVRRGFLLTGLWVLGVTASVAVAFTAVGSVASRVVPPGVGRLSAAAVDRALGTTGPSSQSTISGRPSSSGPPLSVRPSPSSTDRVAPPSTSVGPATSIAPRPRPTPTTASASPTSVPHNTVTTSEGGTVWTRCSGPDRIVYVAAVPKSEYERTHDVESAGGIEQWFQSGNHLSKITAECSGGVVHAEVEEERSSDD